MHPYIDERPQWSYKDAFRGYQKAKAGEGQPWKPNVCELSFGYIQRLWLERQGDVIRGTVKVFNAKDVAEAGFPFRIPADIGLVQAPDMTESVLVERLENTLTDQTSSKGHLDYASFTAQHAGHRSALGIMAAPLLANERLLSTKRHVQGIHSSIAYLSPGNSFTFIRKEEIDLQSASMLWCGFPVLWVVVSPRQSSKLESRLVEHLNLRAKCSQFVRHEHLIIPPSTLNAWGLNFSVFVQMPGELVRTDYQAYHYTWNMGPTVTERVNCCEVDWAPPPMYLYCREAFGRCGLSPLVTAATMKITGPRPVEITQTTEEVSSAIDVDLEHGPDENREKDSPNQVEAENREILYNAEAADYVRTTSDQDSSSEFGHEGFALISAISVSSISDNGFNLGYGQNCDDDKDARHELGKDDRQRIGSKAAPDEPRTPQDQSFNYESIHQDEEFAGVSVDLGSSQVREELLVDVSVDSNSNSNSLDEELSTLFLPHKDDEFFEEYGIYNAHKSARRLPQTMPVVTEPDTPPLNPLRQTPSNSSELETQPQIRQPSSSQESNGLLLLPKSHLEEGLSITLDSEKWDRETLQFNVPTANGMAAAAATPEDIEIREKVLPSASALALADAIPSSQIPHDQSDKAIAQQIEKLIEVGTRLRHRVPWAIIQPSDVTKMLETFRPGEWLNDNAIMETLDRLARGRSDVHVVDSHDFSAAYAKNDPERIRRWSSPSIVLIPVFFREYRHWFLITLNFAFHSIFIHETEAPQWKSVEQFVCLVVAEFGPWAVEYSVELHNDGNNCGIIVLNEAETVIDPNVELPKNFNLLRKRYLTRLLGDIVSVDQNESIVYPSDVELICLQSPSPRTPGKDSVAERDVGEGRSTTLPNLEFLASAIGCKDVLQGLRDMVTILHSSPRTVGQQGTFDIYHRARGYWKQDSRGDNVSSMSPSAQSEINIALDLFNERTETHVNSDATSVDFEFPSKPLGEISDAVQLYKEGRGYHVLGMFKKDISALYICKTFRILVEQIRQETIERKRAKRRKFTPKPPTGEPGRGADTRAYQRLIDMEGSNRSPDSLKVMKKANGHGAYLLRYEAACGAAHPLWMLFPTESIKCPMEPSIMINRGKGLNEDQIKSLLALLQERNPLLWESLPKLEEELTYAFRGEKLELETLQVLEAQAVKLIAAHSPSEPER